MGNPRLWFFLGKGGVGKTTCSALTALLLAQQGYQVLLISLDPAHNLGDVLNRGLKDKPRRIVQGLYAAVDVPRKRMDAYIRQRQEEIKSSYSYQSAFNLDHHLDILRYAPGIEETALFYSLSHYWNLATEGRKQYDIVLLDMPPTGMAMQLFRLPGQNLQWLGKLQQLRHTILEKQQIIAGITKHGRGADGHKRQDGILAKLQKQVALYETYQQLFTDGQHCLLHMVFTEEALAIAEAQRAMDELRQMLPGCQIALIANKILEDMPEIYLDAFEQEPRITRIPLAHTVPLGIENLQRIVTDYATELRQLLPTDAVTS